MREQLIRLAIVSPCYNESEVLLTSANAMIECLRDLREAHGCSDDSYILFVDDGSQDDTWVKILEVVEKFPRDVRGLRLANNVGHQNALAAGLDYVTGKCDASITIDADLQDDLRAVGQMVTAYRNGSEIVFGVRKARQVDGAFKKLSALGFYRLMHFMGVKVVYNHADFRLISAKALTSLREFHETHIFLRGLVPLLHSRTSIVSYDRGARIAGETKYPLRKMLSLAWNGITSFSVSPLRLITILGTVVFAGSLIMTGYAFIGALSGHAVPGWASVTVPLYLLGGLIMLSLGVVGEYVGKVFLEVKRRPRYLIDSIVVSDEMEAGDD